MGALRADHSVGDDVLSVGRLLQASNFASCDQFPLIFRFETRTDI